MSKRILHVVTNVSRYKNVDEPTGLWLGSSLMLMMSLKSKVMCKILSAQMAENSD